ncbi:MAG: M24 family metallopeptidase [Chloroflexota bacterium]|nr:M24 family metallopeptidase [Chloroflexota bacterium]
MDDAEQREKEVRLRAMMQRQGLDAVLLGRSANVAWLSGGGRSYINIATDSGVGSLLVTPHGRYLMTDVIEAERLHDEEGFGEGGWEVIAEPWYEPRMRLDDLTKGLKVGTDAAGTAFADVSGEVAQLRWTLTPAEVERFRALGADAGAAIGEAASRVRPGMAEYEIAGLLADAAYRHNAVPIVTLVSTDERTLLRRHPLPTERRMEGVAMLVLCARRHGLVASATRMVHSGHVPSELRNALRAVATVDAETVLATRPGAKANDIFAHLQAAYERVGYPGEWQRHHQGGLAGYEAREYVATPYTEYVVESPQAFAWNPSVPGAKSEDTFLMSDKEPELLTASPGWPQQTVAVNGVMMERPDILQID